jgi:hypothetical protein
LTIPLISSAGNSINREFGDTAPDHMAHHGMSRFMIGIESLVPLGP